MHKVAMEMGKWAMEKAKTHGFDNLSAQDWDDLKDCMESVKCAICADKDYRIVEAMDECEQEEKYLGRMGYDRYRYSNGIGMQMEDLRRRAADIAWDIARICTWERTIG